MIEPVCSGTNTYRFCTAEVTKLATGCVCIMETPLIYFKWYLHEDYERCLGKFCDASC